MDGSLQAGQSPLARSMSDQARPVTPRGAQGAARLPHPAISPNPRPSESTQARTRRAARESRQMSLAFIFPGQGSQSVGMGVDLAQAFAPAREVFEEVDDALGQKLSALMRDGPEGELTLTENAQPALMAASLAVVRVLEQEFDVGVDKAAFVAGHSLGEYS